MQRSLQECWCSAQRWLTSISNEVSQRWAAGAQKNLSGMLKYITK
jgi:hypothetical protein